jgi:hypothetical protein
MRSVAIRPGSSPLTRMRRGPSSLASVLASPARPGRRPLEIASPGIGLCTELDSTQAIEPPAGPSASATRRVSRSVPRKTDSKAARQASSSASTAVPIGGPPTLTRAPSSPSYAACAASTSRCALAATPRSAATPTACAGPPSSCAARSTAAASRAPSTTRAPSATSASAVARPRPREPPLTTYTRPASPRSTRRSCRAGVEGRNAGTEDRPGALPRG